MLSTFNENHSYVFYNTVVLVVFFALLVVTFVNMHLLQKRFDEYTKSQKHVDTTDVEATDPILSMNKIGSWQKCAQMFPELTHHLILSLMLCVVFIYGYADVQNAKTSVAQTMIATIEKNNEVQEMSLVNNDEHSLICSEDYSGTIHAVLWKNTQGEKKMGLLIGQKDIPTQTCRFVLKPVTSDTLAE